MTKGIAVVGSSGGGAATLGHTDPVDLLRNIQTELGRCAQSGANYDESISPPKIRHALVVSLSGGRGLDGAGDDSPAILYAVGCEEESDHCSSSLRVRVVCSGPLRSVNDQCRRLDSAFVAESIRSGDISGMISISSDPGDVNSASFQAAARCGTPVTGSGGTSISHAASICGITIVGNAGGSVATTTYTRSVSYVFALANAWEKWTYSPFQPSVAMDGTPVDEAVHPAPLSVLNSCVPVFVSVCVARYALALSSAVAGTCQFDGLSGRLIHLRSFLPLSLPIACSVIAGTAYAPEMGSVVQMASVIASGLGCNEPSILAGLLGGFVVARLSKRGLFGCIKLGVPATMTNILVAGGVGCFVAMLGQVLQASVMLACFTDLLRNAIHLKGPSGGALLDALPLRWGYGFLVGATFCYGSKRGWYHKIYLPLILIEMERGNPSILGAIDECTLVLVSAGICLGNVIAARLTVYSPTDADRQSSERGIKINLLCGDFIEAAYPYMERSCVVNAFGYLASGVSAAILYGRETEQVMSSAYVPVGVSIMLAHDSRRMATASAAAMGISFVGSMFANACLPDRAGYRHMKQA